MIIHKLSMGSCKVPHKIWSRSVQPFLRLLDTNKQTDSKIFILLGFKGASRHLLFQLWTCSLCIIVKQKQEKFRGCYKKIVYFQNVQKSKFEKSKFLEIRSSVNLPWGHARSRNKFGPDRFSRVDVYWIQTNKQTSKVYIY